VNWEGVEWREWSGGSGRCEGGEGGSVRGDVGEGVWSEGCGSVECEGV
jgi:hypothetical protein